MTNCRHFVYNVNKIRVLEVPVNHRTQCAQRRGVQLFAAAAQIAQGFTTLFVAPTSKRIITDVLWSSNLVNRVKGST